MRGTSRTLRAVLVKIGPRGAKALVGLAVSLHTMTAAAVEPTESILQTSGIEASDPQSARPHPEGIGNREPDVAFDTRLSFEPRRGAPPDAGWLAVTSSSRPGLGGWIRF